jgi:hypothetical protein
MNAQKWVGKMAKWSLFVCVHLANLFERERW